MMLESSDKSFLVKKLVLVSSVTAVLAVLADVGIEHLMVANPAVPAVRVLMTPSGDTPVVLVGDSIIFKAPVVNQTWQTTGSATQYYDAPSTPVATIAIKSDSSQAESDPTSDKMSLGIAGAVTWDVDEYAKDKTATPSVEFLVASINYQASANNNINLTLKDGAGHLCLSNSNTVLTYGRAADCSDFKNFQLTRATLTATTSNGSQASGTFSCADMAGTVPSPGKCKVAFRGPLH
jgi:hypothetical protein